MLIGSLIKTDPDYVVSRAKIQCRMQEAVWTADTLELHQHRAILTVAADQAFQPLPQRLAFLSFDRAQPLNARSLGRQDLSVNLE